MAKKEKNYEWVAFDTDGYPSTVLLNEEEWREEEKKLEKIAERSNYLQKNGVKKGYGI